MPTGIYDHYKIRGENNPSKRPEVKEKLRKNNSLKEYYKTHSVWNKGLKGIHLSPKTEFKKGNKRVFTEEQKIKASETRKRLIKEGKIVLKTHTDKWRESHNKRRGTKMSSEAVEKTRKTKRELFIKGLLIYPKGEKHPQWKGGITPLQNSIRGTDKYKIWSRTILERDGFKCCFCGYKGKLLTAHHIKFFNVILKQYEIKSIEEALNCDELWDINNGVTLCKDCHKQVHKCLKFTNR